MKIRQTHRGVTLIETLIYLALFTIVIGGLVASAYAFFESISRNQTQATLQEEQDFLMSKIDWALDGAATVTAPGAGSSGTTLTVRKFNGATISIAISGGNMTLNGAQLNNENTTITGLTFFHSPTSGLNAPESVAALMSFTTHTPNGGTVSRTASTTRYLRK